MKKIEIFDFFADDFAFGWKHNLLQGVLFIIFGLLIIKFPQIIAFMVSAFFILLGAIIIVGALFLRKLRKRYELFRNELFDLF